MDAAVISSFATELRKLAAPRAVLEARKALSLGQHGLANQIAQASGKLGLKPRYLKDVSIGGAEAGVDLMMGHAWNPTTGASNPSGLIARKLYKPDSQLHRGEFTSKILDQKQRVTDATRALSPEAKQIVPDMFGHTTLGAGEKMRHTSMHEYVPDATSVFHQPAADAKRDIDAVHQNVLLPMKQRGMELRDTIAHGGVNDGNVVKTPTGPKVLDFLPHLRGEANPAMESYVHHATGTPTAYQSGGQNLQSLRKEVFNPQLNTVRPGSSFMQTHARAELPTIPAFEGFSAPPRKAPGNSLNWGSL